LQPYSAFPLDAELPSLKLSAGFYTPCLKQKPPIIINQLLMWWNITGYDGYSSSIPSNIARGSPSKSEGKTNNPAPRTSSAKYAPRCSPAKIILRFPPANSVNSEVKEAVSLPPPTKTSFQPQVEGIERL
jgi:hypothetical protein